MSYKAAKKQKVNHDEEKTMKDLVPSGFNSGSFDECIYGFDRAQSDNSELWLFKLPPEVSLYSLLFTLILDNNIYNVYLLSFSS